MIIVIALGSNNLLSRYLELTMEVPRRTLHESAYIPMRSWRASMDEEAPVLIPRGHIIWVAQVDEPSWRLIP